MDEPLSNEDVEDRLRHVNGFVGVCSYDLLADLRDGEFCVANTDNDFSVLACCTNCVQELVPLSGAPAYSHWSVVSVWSSARWNSFRT